MIEGFEKWVVNASISQSAVRNHGKGIVRRIRYELQNRFFLKEFMVALKTSNTSYQEYLNSMTRYLVGKAGFDRDDKSTNSNIRWGAARKCINLVARTTVYNAFVWKENNIKTSDFKMGGVMNRLELPLDSYSVKGIFDDCKRFNIEIPGALQLQKFTIIRLTASSSKQIQKMADCISEKRKACKIHLDVIYWRNNQEEK